MIDHTWKWCVLVIVLKFGEMLDHLDGVQVWPHVLRPDRLGCGVAQRRKIVHL